MKGLKLCGKVEENDSSIKQIDSFEIVKKLRTKGRILKLLIIHSISQFSICNGALTEKKECLINF